VSDTVLVRTLLPALAAALLFASACASSRGIPPPQPGAAGPGGAVGTRTGSTLGASAASVALSLLGSPYRNGGTDPTGFDCSGLVQYVFGQAGLALPRSVREQMRLGTPVDDDVVEAGDLLFFAIDGRTVSHVAIAVGPDGFVHAPSARGVVREERLSAGYWRRRFSGARRLRAEFPRPAS
jgi:cell wall-associated NlpC family hydrolase